MNKEHLIFNWRNTEVRAAGKIIPAIIVGLIFVFFFSIINVGFATPRKASLKNVSVLFFPDDETGRAWRLKAEEEGPFPGRLEIDPRTAISESRGVVGLNSLDLWRDYSIEMKPFQSSARSSVERIAPKGLRYFPPRKTESVQVPKEAEESVLSPVLIPYDKAVFEWLPEESPPFTAKLGEGTTSASWRFLLNLRSNGTVAQCFSLSGGREESLMAMIDWLESQRFKESPEEVRWVGLRVEFLNKKTDESDSE